MIEIESRDRSHFATLTDGEVITVELWKYGAPLDTGQLRWVPRRIGQWQLDCPWHVALDKVHAIVFPMTRDD